MGSHRTAPPAGWGGTATVKARVRRLEAMAADGMPAGYTSRAMEAVAATGQRALAAALRMHLASLAMRRREFDAVRAETA